MDEARALASAPEYPSLPPMVRALCGATFDPREDRWSFHDGLKAISINFSGLHEYASNDLIRSIKASLIWYIENTEGETALGRFMGLKTLLREVAITQGGPVSVIDEQVLINYRASLTPNSEGKLGSISAFLKRWHSMRVPGVTDAAAQFLKEVRLKGYPKGTAVLTMDPNKGPLTDVERSAEQSALNEAFSNGRIDTDDYLLGWLCLLLGQRNIQFSMLKVCDALEIKKSDGSYEYVLRIPRAKQSSAEVRRDEFKDRLITPSIGRILIAYAEDVRKQFEYVPEYSDDPSQAPLFPNRGTVRLERQDFYHHTDAAGIGVRVSSIFKSLKVYSERTGKPIKVTSKRLRHTIGTIAAQEGHGELIIAELLDHSDTQNVGIYVKATPEIVERIDRALALRIAPLAHAFAGSVIQDESEALRGNDPTSRIVDPRFDEKMKPMGNCGRNGSCGFFAPVACYTCKSFQAWIDGPHEAVLDYLLAERERLMLEADSRIAAVNDRTILAVAELVKQVRAMREER